MMVNELHSYSALKSSIHTFTHTVTHLWQRCPHKMPSGTIGASLFNFVLIIIINGIYKAPFTGPKVAVHGGQTKQNRQ